MDDDLTISTFANESLIFGDTQAAGFSKNNYLGYRRALMAHLKRVINLCLILITMLPLIIVTRLIW